MGGKTRTPICTSCRFAVSLAETYNRTAGGGPSRWAALLHRGIALWDDMVVTKVHAGGVVQADPDNPCDPVWIDVLSEQPVTPSD